MKTIALLLALIALPHPAQQDDTVARATDLVLSRAELGEWLVSRYGALHVDAFLAEMLVLREAQKRGLFPTPDDVTAAWETEHTRVVEMIHNGREDRYLSHLAGRGYTLETWEAHRRQEITVNLCEVSLAQSERVITEEALLARFADIYGEEGEHTSIEVLFFSAYRDVKLDEGRPDVALLKEQARERALAAAEAWRGGRTLEELRPDGDPISSDFVHDGRVEVYRRNLLGTTLDLAVNSLDRPGEVSPPVGVFDGSYVVRLAARRDVSFVSVKSELTEMLAAALATSGERSLMRAGLVSKYHGEVLLR